MTRPSDQIAAATAAHRRLLSTLDTVTDDVARRPSLLPDWSVGHVLTHLARNADSFVRILDGAGRGEHLEQYEGGAPARAAAIEAGARRPAIALVADVHDSTERLENAFADATDEAWAGHGLHRAGGGTPWPCAELPSARWREVEIHHADLGLGYTPADWPQDFVDFQLPLTLAELPERLDPANQRAWLAWLLGRTAPPATDQLAAWQREHRQ